jgi:tryptophan synthase beta subunit
MRLAPAMAPGSVMVVNLSGRGGKDGQGVAEVLKGAGWQTPLPGCATPARPAS